MKARPDTSPFQGNGLETLKQEVLAHLDAAYNLAHWLTLNDQDAQDVVVEACSRALRSFESFRAWHARTWLLRIVHDTCHARLQQDCRLQSAKGADGNPCPDPSGKAFLQGDNGQPLRQALRALRPTCREVLILRELEGLCYREIAQVTGISIGAVLSRLQQARDVLRERLSR